MSERRPAYAPPSEVDPAGNAEARPLRLACEVCAREFTVAVAVYRALSGVVSCPKCGSTDLVLLDPGGDVGPAHSCA